MTKRAFIVDPCLGRMTGHWENFCRRIYGELEQKGYETSIICQSEPQGNIVAGMRIIPTFTRSPYTDLSTQELYLQECAYFSGDFAKIDGNLFHDGDLLVCPTIFPQILQPLLAWIEHIKSHASVTSAIIFQFPAGYENTSGMHDARVPAGVSWSYSPYIEHYMANAASLAFYGPADGVFYFASSQQLAENFSRLLGIAVTALPMPAPRITLPATVQEPAGQLTVGYFGHASFAKGTHFLESIMDATLAKYPAVDFLLHSNPNPNTAEIIKRLSVPRERVTIASGHLSQEELLSTMAKADIILMPYDPATYRTTPSAIFTECSALGKVFVIPDGTWLSTEAATSGMGHVLFSEFNAAAITAALETAIADFAKLHEASQKNHERFLTLHGASHFIDQLMSRVSEAA